MNEYRVTVLGVGNLMLQDDGVGIHALQQLEKESWPPEVEFIDGATSGYDLLPTVSAAAHLIVLDAVKGGCEPGAIYRLRPEVLQETRDRALSLHQVSFLEALEMSSWLGPRPPAIIYGVEPAVIDWGLELTPAVAAVLPRLLELVKAEIHRILSGDLSAFAAVAEEEL